MADVPGRAVQLRAVRERIEVLRDRILRDRKLLGMRSRQGEPAVMVLFDEWFRLSAYLREEFGMAAKKTKVVEWVGFYNVTLTAAQDEAFESWDVDGDDLLLMLDDVVSSGHKLTVVFDSKTGSYSASLTCSNPEMSGAGYTMSAYSSEFWEALRLLVYKHVEVLGGEWDVSKAGNRPRRG